MTQVDPWNELSTRYRHDERAQFLLFVEQLAEAQSMITSGELVKQRLALVVLDNLAEMLMHRHKERILWIGREPYDYAVPRLGDTELRELNSDFGARVRLARTEIEDVMVEPTLRQLLDDLDVEIFRTAHAYRGRVYHGDQHNPAALPLLAQAYLQAVGRAFVRQQSTGSASSSDAISERLTEFGYSGKSKEWGPGLFSPSEAAEEITQHLTGELTVGLEEATRELSVDLELRADWAEAMIEDLVGDGYPRERLPWALAWGEFWDVHGSDDRIVALEQEKAELWQRRIAGQRSDESFERTDELMRERNDRVRELWEKFEPTLHPSEIDRVRTLGKRLGTAKDLGALFNRYRRLDERMEKLERNLEELAIGWDRHIQDEVDRIRGK